MQVIKDNYATFAVPYNGEDNNDYVDGKGFCCNDGSLETVQARALARAAKNNFQEGDIRRGIYGRTKQLYKSSGNESNDYTISLLLFTIFLFK